MRRDSSPHTPIPGCLYAPGCGATGGRPGSHDALLWEVALGVTEWGHLLALFTLIIALPGCTRGGRIGFMTGLVGLAAAGLALSPQVRGYLFARQQGIPLSLLTTLVGSHTPHQHVDTTTYTASDGTQLGMDIYRANSRSPAPCVVIIHGGSWSGGSRHDFATLSSRLAAAGIVVAAIDYQVAPAHPFPAALNNVRAAIASLKTQAVHFGIDSTRFVLLGRSAGGQLALLAAYTTHDSAIRAVVGLYPPTDLRFGYLYPSNPHVIDSRAVLRAYLGGPPETVGAQYDAASPIFAVSPATVPTLLIHGVRDELVSVQHSDRLAATLGEARRPFRYLRLPWATHGCDFNPNGPCGQITEAAVREFIIQYAQ